MSLRALFSSISGVQSDSQWLDVIGNNISNSGTVGYKASRVEFADQLSQNLFGGTSGDLSTGQGGTDPQQVGTGTRLASIDTIFTQGPTLNTGIATDVSIQGDGFLAVKQGNQNYLTRAGNLTFDSNGFLVDQNGGRVQGFNALLQYNKQTINSFSSVPGQPAVVTNASFALSTNIASLTDIQISRDLVLPPKATTEVTFKGNLDSLQQPNVLDLFPGLAGGPPFTPSLPIGLDIAAIGPAGALDNTRLTVQPTAGGGFTLEQVANLANPFPGTQTPTPLVNGIINLRFVQIFAGSYVWDQQPPVPPAEQLTAQVFDSLGNPRQITVQFYQVNDLGANGINNPSGPNQVCYAWYAFDTSDGQKVSTATLLGGTGIGEGDLGGVTVSYDRGVPLQAFAGDFLWFNTDGSLASSGGIGGPPAPPGVPNFMSIPRVYLPPLNQANPVSPIPTLGAEITPIALDFGTFGLLTKGQRDGLYSDAEGSYEPVNGVITYVPKSTAFAASQDGYGDGMLQSLNFEPSGIIQGSFSNGQRADLAQLALAQAQNEDGLAKTGSNYYQASLNSGFLQMGLAGKKGLGTIQGGSLEGSNVDLSLELSNMIIAQRSFATNARMISTINQTLDTLSHLGQ